MKRFLCLLLVLLTLLASPIPLPAAAAAKGECGDSVSWSFNNTQKRLLITGSGKITGFGEDIDNIKSKVNWLIIREGITAIAADAFAGFNNLKYVELPVSIKAIEENAFSGCDIDGVYYRGSYNRKQKTGFCPPNTGLPFGSWTYSYMKPTVLTIEIEAATSRPRLEWTQVSGANKYRVYRATSEDGPYTLIKTTQTRTRTFDYDVVPGIKYYYKVRAIDTDRAVDVYSAYSEVKSHTCDLHYPHGEITLSKEGKPKITWETVEGAEKYYIYRCEGYNSVDFTKIKTAIKARSFTDTTAERGKVYNYVIRAIHENREANSGYSGYLTIQSK